MHTWNYPKKCGWLSGQRSNTDRGSDVTRTRRVHQSGGSLEPFLFYAIFIFFFSWFFFLDFFSPSLFDERSGRSTAHSRRSRTAEFGRVPRQIFPAECVPRRPQPPELFGDCFVVCFFFFCLPCIFLPYFLLPHPRIHTTSVTLRSRSARPVLCLFLARSWHTTPPQKCSQKNALFSPPLFGNPSSPSQARGPPARRLAPAAPSISVFIFVFVFLYYHRSTNVFRPRFPPVSPETGQCLFFVFSFRFPFPPNDIVDSTPTRPTALGRVRWRGNRCHRCSEKRNQKRTGFVSFTRTIVFLFRWPANVWNEREKIPLISIATHDDAVWW